MYVSDISSALINLMDVIQRVPNFEPYFIIPSGTECDDFTVPLLQNLVDTSNLNFMFDAEGPFRIATSSVTFSSEYSS